MARRLSFAGVVLIFVGLLHAQPRQTHILKAVPLPILNPLHQSVQFGYEFHYNKMHGIHLEAGYFDNDLIYTKLYGRKMRGVKLRGDHRFYFRGSRVEGLWDNIHYLGPHVLLQSGSLYDETQFARHGGAYYETMQVQGRLTQVGLGASYGLYTSYTGHVLYELSIQAGIKAHKARSHMPDDIAPDIFPPVWRSTSIDTWHMRPMINITFAIGYGWKELSD